MMRFRRHPLSWRVEVIKGHRDSVEVVLVPAAVRRATWFGDKCVTVAKLVPAMDDFEERLAEAVSEAHHKAAMLRAVR